MNETAIQKKIVDGVMQAGGYAFKLNNRYMAGIPDLYISYKGLNILAEVKIGEYVKTKGLIKIDITELQKNVLKHIQKAGGLSCVITYLEYGKDKYLLADDYVPLEFSFGLNYFMGDAKKIERKDGYRKAIENGLLNNLVYKPKGGHNG